MASCSCSNAAVSFINRETESVSHILCLGQGVSQPIDSHRYGNRQMPQAAEQKRKNGIKLPDDILSQKRPSQRRNGHQAQIDGVDTGSAMGDGQHALVFLLIHDSVQGFDHLTFVILLPHVCAAQRALPGPGHELAPGGLPGAANLPGCR